MIAEEVQVDKWYEFYKARVNSDYQLHFNDRYRVMIGYISGMKIQTIKEEGVGIGSLPKSLEIERYTYIGTDISEKMLSLCDENVHNFIMSYQEDILNPKDILTRYDLVVGHGVLEHFSDEEIKKIWNRQTTIGNNVMHYVPLDKYQCPSFGDERLLPYEYWLELVEPFDYVLFNNGHDLLLIN